jgi:hypothetical protein
LYKNKISSDLESTDSFKFELDPRGKTMTTDEKVAVFNKFDDLYFNSKVDLKHPQRTYIIVDNVSIGMK